MGAPGGVVPGPRDGGGGGATGAWWGGVVWEGALWVGWLPGTGRVLGRLGLGGSVSC